MEGNQPSQAAKIRMNSEPEMNAGTDTPVRVHTVIAESTQPLGRTAAMTPSTRLSTTAMRSAGIARRSEKSSRCITIGATGASMEKLRPRSPRIASHSQPKYCSYQGRSRPSCRRRVSNSAPVSDVQFRSRTSTASPGRTWRMTKMNSETPTRVMASSHSRRIRYRNMGWRGFLGARASRPLEQPWASGPLRAGRPRSQERRA